MKKSISEDIKNKLERSSSRCDDRERVFVQKYLGTKRTFINVKSQKRDEILKQTIKIFQEMPDDEIREVLDDMFLSDTFELVNFAGKLLAKSRKIRGCVTFDLLVKWLAITSGWAECDSICQSLFSESEVLEMWADWQKNIRKFCRSKNIQLRRASLVLQCKPARGSNDPRILALGLETVEKLKHEKEVLITKAVSWLLRSLAAKNGPEMLMYLQKNKESLPKIAYRETMKKIETGKK